MPLVTSPRRMSYASIEGVRPGDLPGGSDVSGATSGAVAGVGDPPRRIGALIDGKSETMRGWIEQVEANAGSDHPELTSTMTVAARHLRLPSQGHGTDRRCWASGLGSPVGFRWSVSRRELGTFAGSPAVALPSVRKASATRAAFVAKLKRHLPLRVVGGQLCRGPRAAVDQRQGQFGPPWVG